MSAGNLPPFAASSIITCLCSQMFMLREAIQGHEAIRDCFVASLLAMTRSSLVLAAVAADIPVAGATFFIREPFRS
jgi:hypothetical protein